MQNNEIVLLSFPISDFDLIEMLCLQSWKLEKDVQEGAFTYLIFHVTISPFASLVVPRKTYLS